MLLEILADPVLSTKSSQAVASACSTCLNRQGSLSTGVSSFLHASPRPSQTQVNSRCLNKTPIPAPHPTHIFSLSCCSACLRTLHYLHRAQEYSLHIFLQGSSHIPSKVLGLFPEGTKLSHALSDLHTDLGIHNGTGAQLFFFKFLTATNQLY